MSGKENLKCAKCGITSKEDSSLTFHRFPQPSSRGCLKAKVWAKFCFPNEDWTSDESLSRLYKQHKMLCGKHFDNSSFTNDDRKRLNKFAIPVEARNILADLRNELLSSTETQMISVGSASQSLTSGELCPYKSPNPGLTKVLPVSSASQPSTSGELSQFEFSNPELTKVLLVGSASQPSTSGEFSRYKSPSPELTKEPHKTKGLMKGMGVRTIAELTPRKKKLYKRCRSNLTEILRLRKKFKQVKKRDRDLISCLHSNSATNNMIKSKLSSSFYLLLQSQLQNTSKKLAGRRWTLDDKVLALSIYKKSSSCYRLLRRLFCLPSIGTLKMLLNKIPMRCGINEQMLNTIKDITKKREGKDNLCTLAFDEMSIRKNLSYNSKLDQIDGYQDHAGQGRTSTLACKVLTFMAIGVRSKWKQPIAFYFSGAYVTADRLAVLIKEVLSACYAAGLIPVGTVCDCDGVNLRALNSMGSSTNEPFFKHDGHEIVTILDPPHLLKCFRNNFMKHDVQFRQEVEIDGQSRTGVAKWIHLEQLYNTDKNNPNFVFAPSLTQQHLQPKGKQKMKVNLAAQVLSHSAAAGLYAKVAQNHLPKEAIATAEVVSKMDKLFDATNGDTPDRKRGKPLLTNMSSTSLHLNFFIEMKKFFNEMKFLGARSKPPSQNGWLRTINSFEKLYINLKKNGIISICLRRLNQDPLENLFGCIRSNCGSNPNPNTVQFVAALKTSLITNLINNNKNTNCADDNNDLLSNFKVFLTHDKSKIKCDDKNEETANYNINEVEEMDIPQCSGEMQACAYVCGYIVKKNIELNCQACKTVFLAEQNTEVCHLFTSFKEYDDVQARLQYIKPNLIIYVEKAATIINNFLNTESHNINIKRKLRIILEELNIDWLSGCEEHISMNKSKIIESVLTLCIKRFCIKKNRGFIEEAAR